VPGCNICLAYTESGPEYDNLQDKDRQDFFGYPQKVKKATQGINQAVNQS